MADQPPLQIQQDVVQLYQVIQNFQLPDEVRLRACDELHGRLRTFERLLVAHARDRGVPWERIGDALEISKQAAQQRYG